MGRYHVALDIVGTFIEVAAQDTDSGKLRTNKVPPAARDYVVVVEGEEHQIDDTATSGLRERSTEARPYLHRGANDEMWLENLGTSPFSQSEICHEWFDKLTTSGQSSVRPVRFFELNIFGLCRYGELCRSTVKRQNEVFG